MSEHSPLPWRTYPHINSRHYIIDNYTTGLVAADCGVETNKYSKANAEYIVEACNNYPALKQENDKLKEAFKECLDDILSEGYKGYEKYRELLKGE
ncbi:MAG: hypothetical protein N3I35_06835 [Clostridia bacterium]|nr:hypothetical protein [Clostridia bacterium]